MHFGVTFPQTEVGSDPRLIQEFARVTEEANFSFMSFWDHVVGADTAERPDWDQPYSVVDSFHEVFVLMGFLAGITSLELMPTVLVLPQRHAVLVAKQAAEVDLLTGGRFRLGVGIGYSPVEFQALGADFPGRAARFEEQIDVMRRLWCEQSVTFRGQFHDLDAVGLNPLPVQRPIPLWIGAHFVTRPLERIGRIGDGWIVPAFEPSTALTDGLATIRRAAEGAGRDPSIPWQARIRIPPDGSLDDVQRKVDAYRTLGASRLEFNTMRSPSASDAPRVPLTETDVSNRMSMRLDVVARIGELLARG
jgi:probable F420-dependent oxidoreductase